MSRLNAPRELLLCHTLRGPILVFASDAVIGRSLIDTGHFGEEKIDEVLAVLSLHGLAPRCFVDIGANIGTHLLHALDSGHFARAIGVEADPDNFLLLKANVAMRGHSERTSLIHCALSDSNGTAELELCPSNFGDHRVRVADVIQEYDLGESERKTVQVPVDTTDRLFGAESMNWRETLVWIDTQGHEGQILAGARSTLAANAPAVVVEFWPYGLERAGGKAKYFEFLNTVTTIHDINRPNWAVEGKMRVSELLETYERMLAETRSGHFPHTDLLCLRPSAGAPSDIISSTQ